MFDKKIYTKALVEVLYVLERTDDDILEKIPQEIIEGFEKNKDLEYKFEPEETKDIEKLNLSREAKAIIAAIYRDYICNDEQRIEYNKYMFEKELQAEEEKKEKYKTEDMFKNKKEEVKENVEITEVKKESFIIRIINKIKSIFKK